MNNDSKQKFTAVLLALLLIFALAACGGDPAEDGSDVETIQINMNIEYPVDGKRENVEHYAMTVEENATVLQVLESYSDQEGLAIEVDTSGTTNVTAINEIKTANGSGWVYEVNGETITKAASEYKVKNGDKIVWKFVAF